VIKTYLSYSIKVILKAIKGVLKDLSLCKMVKLKKDKKASKRALLSFLINPTLNTNLNLKHTVPEEVRGLVECLFNLGYNVDVVNYFDRGYINIHRYKLVIGFGIPYEKCLHKEFKCTKIYYANGAHSWQRNNVEWQRISWHHKSRTLWLGPQRLKTVDDGKASAYSDGILVLGNEWSKHTYDVFTHKPVYSIPAFCHETNMKLPLRDWEKAKHEILWFCGNGALLKGLD